jgi:hypothetical protein
MLHEILEIIDSQIYSFIIINNDTRKELIKRIYLKTK